MALNPFRIAIIAGLLAGAARGQSPKADDLRIPPVAQIIFLEKYKAFYLESRKVHESLTLDEPPSLNEFRSLVRSAQLHYTKLPGPPNNASIFALLLKSAETESKSLAINEQAMKEYHFAVAQGKFDAAKMILGELRAASKKLLESQKMNIGDPLGFHKQGFKAPRIDDEKTPPDARSLVANVIVGKIKQGTEEWIFGGVGEFVRKKYAATDIDVDLGEPGQPLKVSWTDLEMKTRTVSTKDMAARAAFPKDPTRSTYRNVAFFADKQREIVFVSISRGKTTFDSKRAAPPAERLHGWYLLLAKEKITLE